MHRDLVAPGTLSVQTDSTMRNAAASTRTGGIWIRSSPHQSTRYTHRSGSRTLRRKVYLLHKERTKCKRKTIFHNIKSANIFPSMRLVGSERKDGGLGMTVVLMQEDFERAKVLEFALTIPGSYPCTLKKWVRPKSTTKEKTTRQALERPRSHRPPKNS